MLFATPQAADGMRRTATVSHTFGETAPLTTTALDADAMLPPSAMDEEMAQNPSEEGFADFLNQQQTAREQKSDAGMTLASSTTAFAPEESSGAKADSAMQIFTDAAQTPRMSQENIVPQVHPGVTFQATLDEAAAAEPTTPMMPQKDYEVVRQIVEQARLLRMPEQTEMVIRLKPEHLGELTLKVSVAASGAVNAAFHTDNAAVRAIIETSMIQLKQELQAQGLKVDNVGVYAGLNDSSLMNGQQQDANAYYAQQGNERSSQGRDAQQALASFEEEQQTLVVAGERSGILAQDGVDYRI